MEDKEWLTNAFKKDGKYYSGVTPLRVTGLTEGPPKGTDKHACQKLNEMGMIGLYKIEGVEHSISDDRS